MQVRPSRATDSEREVSYTIAHFVGLYNGQFGGAIAQKVPENPSVPIHFQWADLQPRGHIERSSVPHRPDFLLLSTQDE